MVDRMVEKTAALMVVLMGVLLVSKMAGLMVELMALTTVDWLAALLVGKTVVWMAESKA